MPKNDALARRWPKGHGGRWQLYLAGFTQEEIADKVGVDRSIVSRDQRSVRDSVCPGESPDVQEACFIQMAKLKFNPEGSQFDPRHPPLEKSMSPEEAAASWNERRIYNPLVGGYGPQLKL
jgi:transcriptional regulator with XRE-family HTH domain